MSLISFLEDTVKSVNSCLTRIRDLNEQIRTHEIYGDNALELRDARNLAIDELSKYMKIDVTYSKEKIDQYTEVEKSIRLIWSRQLRVASAAPRLAFSLR